MLSRYQNYLQFILVMWKCPSNSRIVKTFKSDGLDGNFYWHSTFADKMLNDTRDYPWIASLQRRLFRSNCSVTTQLQGGYVFFYWNSNFTPQARFSIAKDCFLQRYRSNAVNRFKTAILSRSCQEAVILVQMVA